MGAKSRCYITIYPCSCRIVHITYLHAFIYYIWSSHSDHGIIPKLGFGSSFNMAKYSIRWLSGSRKKTEADGIQHNAFGSSVSCPKKERGVFHLTLNVMLHSANHPDIIVNLSTGCWNGFLPICVSFCFSDFSYNQ